MWLKANAAYQGIEDCDTELSGVMVEVDDGIVHRRVPHPSRFCEGWDRSIRFPLVPPIGVDLDNAGFSRKIMPEAAPLPVLWRLDQAPGYRVSVHVAQFFHQLLLRPDVEIIEARKPEWFPLDCRSRLQFSG